MSNDDLKKQVKDIWKAIAEIAKGMDKMSNDFDQLVALINEKVDKLVAIGFREPKDFVDDSKTIV